MASLENDTPKKVGSGGASNIVQAASRTSGLEAEGASSNQSGVRIYQASEQSPSKSRNGTDKLECVSSAASASYVASLVRTNDRVGGDLHTLRRPVGGRNGEIKAQQRETLVAGGAC